MNPVAASRVLVDEDSHLSSNSVADAVAAIARKELAPLAADIDSGKVYPAELLRRFGDAGAWGSHRPGNGAADLRCAIQSMAAIGEVCGATAFMAWCQNTLAWYAMNSANPALVRACAAGLPPYMRRLESALGQCLLAERRHRVAIDHVFTLSSWEAEIERWLGAGGVTALPRTVARRAPLDWRPDACRLGFVGTLDHQPTIGTPPTEAPFWANAT